MASTLPRILGPNTRLTLTTGAGDISMSQYTKIAIEEPPVKKEADVAASRDGLEVFTKRKCKITCTSLRGLNKCYSDLPFAEQRITNIKFETLDEDGEVIADAKDLPNVIRAADNPRGYVLWAVTEKRGNQEEGAGDVELVLESGQMNAID